MILKRKYVIHLLPVLAATTMILTGCSAGSSSGSSEAVNSMNADYGAHPGYRTELASAGAFSNSSLQNQSTTDFLEEDLSNIEKSNRKMIRTVDLTLETKYSSDISLILSQISRDITGCGGYVEYQSMDSGWITTGTLTARIPENKVNTFLEKTQGNEKLKTKDFTDHLEDVTLQYTDVESRLQSATAAKKRYMEMLQTAETVTDVLEIQSRLDSIIAEEESYQARILTMDNQINYTTVNIRIDCNVNEEQPPFSEQAQGKLKEIGEEAGDAFLAGLGWFVMALIWLLFVSPVIILLIFVFRFAFQIRIKKVKRKLGLSEDDPFPQ